LCSYCHSLLTVCKDLLQQFPYKYSLYIFASGFILRPPKMHPLPTATKKRVLTGYHQFVNKLSNIASAV